MIQGSVGGGISIAVVMMMEGRGIVGTRSVVVVIVTAMIVVVMDLLSSYSPPWFPCSFS